MKPSIKAALISALVFPGLGHLVLKQAARGCIFLLPAAVAVIYLLRRVLELADRLMADLNSGALPLDPALILERINASGADSPGANLAAWICLLCWAGSIADALWLGRRRQG